MYIIRDTQYPTTLPVTDEERDLCIRFTDNIKILEADRKIPESHLEFCVGVYIGYMSALRHYRRRVKDQVIHDVAAFFGVTYEDITSKQMPKSVYNGICKIPYTTPVQQKKTGKKTNRVPVNPKTCQRCVYRSADHSEGCCDYIIFTGKRRPKKPFDMDWDECPQFEKDKKGRKNRSKLFTKH